jgi:hypothetical protein
MIAGTSTGGILTCVYLAPDKSTPPRARFSAQDALNLYLQNGDDIFDRSIWKQITSVSGLVDEKYSAEALEKVLNKYFGKLHLSQLLRPCLITAYNTKRYEPFFYTQHDAKLKPEREFLVRDAARATSAAPTYFEMALSESLDDIPNAAPMIDGGVFANNPSACALVEALRLGTVSEELKIVAPEQIDNIVMLSLGTGQRANSIGYKEGKDWGLAGWARPLIGILMDGVSQTVNYQLETVFASLGLTLAHQSGSVTPFFGATMDGTDATGDHMLNVAILAGGSSHSTIHCLGDGAPWIADQCDRVYGDQGHYLIDFYHLCDYLYAAASGCQQHDDGVWLDEQKRLMKTSQVAVVIQNLKAHLEQEGIPDKDAPVRLCHRYLLNRTGQFEYAKALDSGLPIGSGEIESAHRYIIQKRLKIAGAWWKKNNARKMLVLRTLRANGAWQKYWKQKYDLAA